MLPLTELLAYENPSVIHHFCHHHPAYTTIEAQQCFTDLMAWMWLNAQRKIHNKTTYLFGPLLNLDAMWHIFILHTRDYSDFCQLYFGAYFHHDVEPPGFEHQLTAPELADFLQDCFAYLGDDWVKRNFADFLK